MDHTTMLFVGGVLVYMFVAGITHHLLDTVGIKNGTGLLAMFWPITLPFAGGAIIPKLIIAFQLEPSKAPESPVAIDNVTLAKIEAMERAMSEMKAQLSTARRFAQNKGKKAVVIKAEGEKTQKQAGLPIEKEIPEKSDIES